VEKYLTMKFQFAVRNFFLLTTLMMLTALMAICRIGAAEDPGRDPIRLTAGPMLGNPTATSMKVWGRTSDAGGFIVKYGESDEPMDQMSEVATTLAEDDFTGTVTLTELSPDTRYHYQIWVNERPHGQQGSFLTLPSAD